MSSQITYTVALLSASALSLVACVADLSKFCAFTFLSSVIAELSVVFGASTFLRGYSDRNCASAVSAPLIDKAVKEILINAPLKKNEIRYLIQKANQDRQRILDSNLPELRNIEQALLKARKEKSNVENAFLNGLVDHSNKDVFNQKLAESRKEIERLEARDNELAEMVKFYEGEVDFDEVFKNLKTYSDLIRKTDRPEVLQEFVKSRVARIDMAPDRKSFKLSLRAFDPLYQDSIWWALQDSNL